MKKIYFIIAVMALYQHLRSQCGTPPCNFLYVTTTGSPANPGTANCPTTLEQALVLANSIQNIILVQTGSYTITTTLVIPEGITIDGGYDLNWIKNSTAGYTTLNIEPPLTNNGSVGYYIGIQPQAGANNFSLKDLRINVQTSGASGAFNNSGISIYGIYLSGQTGFSITRCVINTGNGSAGNTGVYDGTTGGGLAGGAGAFTGYSPYNGMAVGSNCGGGNGCSVDPGCPGANGTAGTEDWGGGAAGAGGNDCTSGGCNIFGCNASGCAGNNGNAGDNGNSAPVYGGVASAAGGLLSVYFPVSGSEGYAGDGGGGGGGGGSGEGGTCCTCTCGNGWAFGGTGGNGGDGGAGGAGGYGGGGSFCIYAWGGSGNIIDCSLNAGTGGMGGDGAPGSPGADGSGGGPGENRGGCDGGLGGYGGNGGSGGAGGTGQQGATGLSAAYEALNGASLNGNFGSSNIVPSDGIVTANWYSGCTNSEIDLTKTSGDGWNLLNGSAFIDNLTSTSSSYSATTSPVGIYYPAGTIAGSYSIALGGTTLTDFIEITGNRLVNPVNSIINSIPSPCSAAAINLSNSLTTGQQANVIRYDWEIMNTSSPGTVVYSSALANPGAVTIGGGWIAGATYQVRLRLMEKCCGWSIPLWASFTVASPTNAGAISGPSGICSGNPETYSISPVTNATGYTWKVVGGIITANDSTSYSANVTSINVIWTTGGAETVSVQPYNSCGNSSSATTFNVTVIGSPAVTITSTPSTGIICTGSFAELVANGVRGSGGNGVLSYLWSTNSTNSQIEPNPTSNTTYTVTVTDQGSGCTATASQTIIVEAPATVSAGPNQTVCVSGGAVPITGASAGNYTSLSWSSTGTGTFVNGDSLDAGYTASSADVTAGQVTVTLTAVAACGNVTSSKTLTLTPGPEAIAGSDQAMCTTSNSITIYGTAAYHYGSLSWTTSGTGTFTGGTTLNPVYTPSGPDISADSVVVTLTATSLSTCPNAVSSKVLYFYAPPTVNAGPSQAMCTSYRDIVLTGATGTNYGSLNWTTNGSGTFTNGNTLAASYTFSPADSATGSVLLTLTAYGNSPCGNVTSNKILTIKAAPAGYAGANQSTCFNSGAVNVTGASASHFSALNWITGGSGTFTGGTTLNPVYTPSAGDIAAGSVTLSLIVTGNAPCGSDTSTKTLSIIQAATANAGGNQAVCNNIVNVVITGASASNYNTLAWTTSGTGTFSGDTSITPTYTPSLADITAGSVTLTLTATDTVRCANHKVSTKVLTFVASPVVNAGSNQVVCSSQSIVALTGASASHYDSLSWTSSGTGTFTNGSGLNASYLPSVGDISGGTVALTLTAYGNSPCGNATSTKFLNITRAATANAGPDDTICSSVGRVPINGASAFNYVSLSWTSTGTGSFAGGSTLTPVYTASPGDIALGSVELMLTASGNPPCGNAADTMILTLIAAPVVSTGTDITTCAEAPVALAGATASNYNSLTWSGSGTGSFSNLHALHPTYTPSLADVTAGSVILTITASGNAPCDSAVSSMLLSIHPSSVDTQSVTACNSYTSPSGNYVWTTSGTYTDTITNTLGCDSIITIHLTFNYSADSTISDSICAGNSYLFNGAELSSTGVYRDTVTGSNGCDSIVTLNLMVLPVFTSSFNASICAGHSYTYNGVVHSTGGQYTDTVTAVNGCDSVVTLNLTVLPVFASSFSAGICSGQSYIFNGVPLTTGGNYTDTLPAVNGCDSVVTLHLTVNTILSSSFSAGICSGQSYLFGGILRTSGGVYRDTLTASGGCDSIVTLNLTVILPVTSSFNASICNGESYLFAGINRSTPGTYPDTLLATNGCDSIVTLHLTVLPVFASSFNVSICGGHTYTYNGVVHSTGGQYTDTVTAVNGCDSIVTLNLTVLPVFASSFSAGICSGQSYIFNGVPLTTGGNYTDTLRAVNGCDSVVTLHLTVNTTLSSSFSAGICSGQSYLFGGILHTTGGIYLDTLTASGGCDSVVMLHLTVISTVSSSFNKNICSGESYLFGGVAYNSTGTYIDTLTASTGCDSVVTLNLRVLPVFSSSFNAGICAGQSYIYNGIAHTSSGQFNDTLTALNGCDSIVTLNLTVLPVLSSAFSASICEGQSYTYNGTVHTSGGQFNDTLTALNGCDSIVTLNLTVLPTRFSSINANICTGQSYNFRGVVLSTGGTYTDTLTTVNGCDSIVTLDLVIDSILASSFSVSICNGQTYLFGGIARNSSGAYNDTLTATGGCDSIVTLNLVILPVFSSSFSDSICAGQTYQYNGIAHTTGGQFNDTLTAVNGCDSVVTLNLEVLPLHFSSFMDTVCAGQGYTFNGTVIYTGGSYADTLTALSGCDSIVTVHLTVLPVDSGSISRSICPGSSFDFNGRIISNAGVYADTLTALNGCDSLVILNLSVTPILTSAFSDSICNGNNYVFGGHAYATSGTYMDTVTASTGCDSIVTLRLSVTEVSDSASVSGQVCTASQTGAAYQWLNCNSGQLISGATLQNFKATQDGNYACIVTYDNCTDTTNCVAVTALGITTINEEHFSLYPNPNNGVFTIEHNYEGALKAQVISPEGRVLMEFNLAKQVMQLDISRLADGVYDIMITDGKQLVKVMKLVKQ